MSSYCVSCVLTPDERDLATSYWFTLGMQGSEEIVEHENIRVKVYFADLETADNAKTDLEKRSPLSPVTLTEVVDEDWNAKWRESMKPAKLAPHFWVSPTWLPPGGEEGDQWIKIEPKMAFGTGHHETTRLAARAIISKKKWIPGKNVLDIGTGSGVLCFVADILGSRSCLGIEIDPDCLENLDENRRENSPRGMMEFTIGTLDCLKDDVVFDMVVMNMLLNESTPCLPQVDKLLRTGGLLVWSGILVDEKETAIDNAAIIASCKLLKETVEHEWWCGVFTKSDT